MSTPHSYSTSPYTQVNLGPFGHNKQRSRPTDRSDYAAYTIIIGGLNNQSIKSIKIRDAHASLGVPRQMPPRWWSPIDTGPLQCGWMMTDINGPVNSFMLSFHDLRSLPLRHVPPMEHCSMIFSNLSWQHTWPNHDKLRRLTTAYFQTYLFVLCSPSSTHIHIKPWVIGCFTALQQ